MPAVEPTTREAIDRPRLAPRWHVVLLDDDDHTYEYVVRMLGELFRLSTARAWRLAREVDQAGRAIVDTTSLERAELKQQQVHSYGPDWRIARCAGSMRATLERADDP